jgi:hypothetical protein
MLRSLTINSRCGTKPNNLPHHTLGPTLPSQPSVWSPEDVIQAPSPILQSRPYIGPNSSIIIIRVISWRRYPGPSPSHDHPCDPLVPSQPSVGLNPTLQSRPYIGPNCSITTIRVISRRRYPSVGLNLGYSDLRLWYHLLEWRSGIRPNSLYPRADTPSSLGPPEPTTIGLGPNSTQKTSLMGEDCPHLYVVLLHHQFLMWD